mgnify:CR=1 FL=1
MTGEDDWATLVDFSEVKSSRIKVHHEFRDIKSSKCFTTLSRGSSFTLIAPSPYLSGDLLFDLSFDLDRDLFLQIKHSNIDK